MKIISFNVAGMQQALKKGLKDMLLRESPDIICLQEVKSKSMEDVFELDGYHIYWNFAERNGYSGTALFTKIKPEAIKTFKSDIEGRIIHARYEKFHLVNVYVPNSKSGLVRLDERLEWDQKLRDYVTSLNPILNKIIICGDFNVTCDEIDVWKLNPKNAGSSPKERASFKKWFELGFHDVFRALYKDKVQYTYYDYKFKDKGWRLDYFLVSDMNGIKDHMILKDKMSDHRAIMMIM